MQEHAPVMQEPSSQKAVFTGQTACSRRIVLHNAHRLLRNARLSPRPHLFSTGGGFDGNVHRAPAGQCMRAGSDKIAGWREC